MRLAFVTVGDTTRKAGGHRYNARLLSGLRGRGVEVEEIVASAEGVGEQRAASHSLGERLAPQEFDVISVDALARVVCAAHLDRWRETTPVVAMVHELPSSAGVAGSGEAERPLEEPLLRADRVVCVSRHGLSILRERHVSPERIHVVPPGLERPTGDAAPDGADGPGESPLRVLRVLCVAQWIPRKNVLGLVRAWRSLPPGHGAILELVGETAADPAYAARVREAVSGSEDIVVRGPVGEDELRRAYSGASVFALPSLYEGYGMVYAEALSYGLPVIAPAAGPVPEVVGDAALLVEPGDEAGLAERLLDLITTPSLRRRLSENAHRRSAELPAWDDTVDGFLAALEAAVAERPRS
ncbi:glycosyltransferase family 4 protein [Rubrobacter aplysinae]|uniref:glycosyltransferase family 4 protein n=1 Tax=Rubrobacter aplysinae TaxID=909625 RepID=UPI00064B847F|nr:glycosyltransferase family 4 protein [Rubrobacter aplysinae]